MPPSINAPTSGTGSDYEKAHARYREMAKAALAGDKQAQADKSKVMNEIVQIERDAARAGTILSAQYRGDKVVVSTEETPTKRSLQEEYVRGFDNDVTVNVGGKEQTMRQYHSKRLLGK